MSLEKNVSWLATFKPVFGQQIEVTVRKDCISVPSAFAFSDMDRLVSTGNIVIMKMYNFRHSQTGGIHSSDDRFVFKIRCMINDTLHLIP